MNSIFILFIIFLAIQRILELRLAKKNEKVVRKEGAIEYDREGYKYIVFMHVGFFISLILEKYLLNRGFNSLSLLIFIIFIFTQLLRYWAITSLGKYWNTKILVVPNTPLIAKGPYKYLKHPNYLAVITEIVVIPLIFSCYITCIIFSTLNFLTLLRRIRIEENALNISK
ncbi:MAG: isoprenylcysteine carboxyl methyltransferase family protein [Thermodesulfobacteriota bacterium]